MVSISCFLVIVLALVAFEAAEARPSGFECDAFKGNRQVSSKCSPFTRRGENEPSAECCVAYRAFVESAKTAEEREQLCSCIQRSARNNPANIANVDALFGKCGLPNIFSADPNFDCKTVN